MRITPKIAAEVGHHEAVVRQAYKDSVGVLTWSVGLTSMSGHKVERYIGNPQTLQRCLEVYLWALDRYADDVRSRFEGVALTQEQFAGALSFHWNTGSILTASWPRHFMAGDEDQARTAFMFWRNPPEIIPRRQAEAALFFDGVWAGDGTMTEWTRLRSNLQPDWSSGVKVEVLSIFEAMLSDMPHAPVEDRSEPLDAVTPDPGDEPESDPFDLTRWRIRAALEQAETLAATLGAALEELPDPIQ